jgi:serine kinase of HPr protein (carbohydrate metabolism regulator)
VSALIHATAVAIGERGVLITGPSGAGKSDLALRLIDRGAVLISDDQVELSIVEGRLKAAAPERISALIEVRGIGLVPMPHCSGVVVSLLVELEEPDRMPQPRKANVHGIAIPCATIDPREGSAPIKVELALKQWGLPE